MTGLTLFARDAFTPTVTRLKAILDPLLDGPFTWATYDDIPPDGDIGQAVILSDFERLPPETFDVARKLYRTLLTRGHRVLNDPDRALFRLPLLSALHEAGINDFRGHAVDAPRSDWRWPVFLRHANNHRGPVSDLLHSEAEVEAALPELAMEHLMATEFCDIRSSDGLYRKYSAFRIGSATFAAHIIYGRSWQSKKNVPLTGLLHEEEYRYVTEFPHRAEVERIFDIANIEFGRIDYGLKNGRPQVWEINILPNPLDFNERELQVCPSAPVYYQRLSAAFNMLMATGASGT